MSSASQTLSFLALIGRIYQPTSRCNMQGLPKPFMSLISPQEFLWGVHLPAVASPRDGSWRTERRASRL